MKHDGRQITQLLHRWREGSVGAEDDLFRLVKPDLHRLARYLLRGERKGYSLQSGDLVDEIYFKLVAAKDRDWRDRRHFFAISARAMRRYLIDRFRARPRVEFVRLDHEDLGLAGKRPTPELALAIDGLLDELEKCHAELCSIVELKVFLGLKDEEAAGVLGLPLRTFQRKWQDARRWLFEKLEADDVTRRQEERRPRNATGRRDVRET
jgi:RNA polymerase sigma factor (TIGR02999 family)